MIAITTAILVLVGAFSYTSLTNELPAVSNLPLLLEPPDGALLYPTRLYDSSGEHLLLSLENPKTVGSAYLYLEPDTFEKTIIPGVLIASTIAAVDPQFGRHSGFYIESVFDKDIRSMSHRLVSDLILQDEQPGLRRTMREMILASQITAHFGHQKVLEWYLNHTHYGYLAFGADAAAKLYFGKSTSELSLAEAALLAAVGKNPELNPYSDKAAALLNRQLVIQEALKYRLVSPDEGIQAVREPLNFLEFDERLSNRSYLIGLETHPFPTFSSLVLSQLEDLIPRNRYERGGLRVITTLDYEMQEQAACVVEAQFERIGNQEPALSTSEVMDCPAARFLPNLTNLPQSFPPGLQASLAVLEPESGRLLTLVSQPESSIPSSWKRSRPLGSLITPFIYLTSFTRGYSPGSMVWDIPLNTPAENNSFSRSSNEFHGPVRLRLAMVNDYPNPVETIIQQVGTNNVNLTAWQFGLFSLEEIFSPSQPYPFESRTVSLLQVCQAFSVFANQGVMTGNPILEAAPSNSTGFESTFKGLEPVSIVHIEDPFASVLSDSRQPQTRSITTPQLAYLITDVLSDESARWPTLGHPNVLEIGRPAAVKIGRTSTGESNWVVGYTPQRVVGVWLGFDSSQTVESAAMAPQPALSELASGLWHALIKYAHQELPYLSWNVPPGVSRVEICNPSGLIPTEDCPNIVQEIFLSGSEPTQSDSYYRALPINRETGHLATIFTPSDQIENRIFFLFPPEAETWALSYAISSPPESYDTLPMNLPKWPNANITQPAMLAVVGGQVEISGSANGEQFDFYRLQVGAGLNPQSWLQIGSDVNQGAEDGPLGTWDTTGLDGLYAIQLLVVSQDQSLQRVTVLVTVDNSPPQIRITYPSNGTRIDAPTEGLSILQADAQDDLLLISVAFYLDETLLATLTQPPYVVPWTNTPGTHTLRVVATDQAGNLSEDSITFTSE